MKHHRRPVENPPQVGVDEVRHLQSESLVCPSTAKVFVLAFPCVVVAERIDAHYLVTVGEQPLTQVRPDESRRAGHDDPSRFAEHGGKEYLSLEH